MPDKLLAEAELVNEARPEDELAGPMRAIELAKEELGALNDKITLVQHGASARRGQSPWGTVAAEATRHLGEVRRAIRLRALWEHWVKR